MCKRILIKNIKIYNLFIIIISVMLFLSISGILRVNTRDNGILVSSKYFELTSSNSLTYTTIDIGGKISSGATIADLDNDGINEIIFASTINQVYAYKGTIKIWNYTTPNIVWTSIIVIDIDNDSEKEVLFGCSDYNFYCLNYTGGLEWVYSDSYLNPVNVEFAIGDIDGDNLYEIIFAKFAQLYVLNGTGGKKWSYTFGINKIDGITLSDISGDNIPEILFYLENGTFYAYFGNGTLYKKVYFKDTPDPVARPLVLEDKILLNNDTKLVALDFNFNVVWSIELGTQIITPCAADLNHDGKYEIIVNSLSGNKTYIINDSGNIINNFTVEGSFSKYSVPAIADFNNDTIPEIVIVSSLFYIVDISGNLLYDKIVVAYGINRPTIGDINGDTIPEVLFGTDNGKVYIIYITEAFSGDPWTLLCQNSHRQGILYDKDHDWIADYIEQFYGTNILNPDTDNDGMPDGWEILNRLQPKVNDASNDNDNDGLSNYYEYKNGTNPNNDDTDMDGMSDGWEVKYSLNPLLNDSFNDNDGDGLSNLNEYKIGTNPILQDTDGDGYSDGTEITMGTDPLNAFDNPINRIVLIIIIILIVVIIGYFIVKKKFSKK